MDAQLAEMITKIHSMPLNPYAKKSQMDEYLEIYNELKADGVCLRELDEAILELKELNIKIGMFQASKVTLHGDLHPRNLFFTHERKIIAVDWEATTVDDPFYDLGFCSLLHNLDNKAEKIFLHAYAQRDFTPEEYDRYSLCKRSSLIFLSLLCIWQAHELKKVNKESYSLDLPLDEWSFYIKEWSKNGEHKAQFFLNWGKACLQKLKNCN